MSNRKNFNWVNIVTYLLFTLSFVFFIMGITLPFFTVTKFWFWSEETSIIQTVGILMDKNEIFLGIITILFSILFPLVKYIVLFSQIFLKREFKFVKILHLGKFSMTEPFILALFIILMKMKGFYFIDVSMKSGAVFFTLAVVTGIILTMLRQSDKSYYVRKINQ